MIVEATFLSKVNNLGFSLISIATAPAPCVYSPEEPISYLAISLTITIADLSSFSSALTQFALS
jgi:hypothetical protein